MSLILDALKKSERERQRDKTPGLQSIHLPLPRRERRSRWSLWLIAAIVAINAAVLAYWRMQQPTAPILPVASTATSDAPKPNVSNPAEAAVQSSEPSGGASTNSTPAASSSAAEFTRMVPAQTSAAQTPAESSLRIEEVGELPDTVRNNLPAMTFSFHVYSTNAQQRTIIINNRRVREGDEVSPGLQLQEITEDGVILLYQQHRIHIGVLSGW